MRLATAVASSFLVLTTGCVNNVEILHSNNISKAIREAEADRKAISTGNLKPYTIDFAESQARTTLRDPESARFSDVMYNKSTGAVCGYLNAKNVYGGYVGSIPFIFYYSTEYNSAQLLYDAALTQVATIPYIEAFCPLDGTTVSINLGASKS